jgi:NAD(P)-dependent dehydrogenase (short-subunit alcohol dehydrogenase family)
MKPRRAARVDLRGRGIIITGASPGSLGAATARILSEWGADVVVTTRSDSDVAAQSIGPTVVGHSLDLTDAASVAAFARWYDERCGSAGLDALINNAGIHLDLRSTWKEPTRTSDGEEIHWRTNYLGAMQLTHLLLPAVARAGQRTGDARVVNVVSTLHRRGRNEFLFAPLTPYNSWNAYGQSKLALVHAASQLTDRYAEDHVRGYAVHPGSVYSNIADRGLEGHRVISAARRLLAPIESRMLASPEDGAQTSVFCATAPDLAAGYYQDCQATEPSDEAKDAAVAARLWDDTARWVGGRTT